MKKFKAIVTKNDGTKKEVYVIVDNRTAKMLAQLDDEMRNDYLVEEYRMFMSVYNEHRNVQSLDKSLDSGLDIVDESQNLLDEILKSAELENVRSAIKMLEPQQQWLVEQIYFRGRSQVNIARQLGIDESSLSKRKERLLKKLKKFLQ